MEKEDLEKLIADQPKDVRGRGVLLFNAVAQCAVAYQKSPSASNLRDWEAAAEALKKFRTEVEAKSDGERPLPLLSDVLSYLQENGWKITQPTLYRHHREGKLVPRTDGAYERSAVDRYGRTFLKQQATGMKVNEKLDELQRRKLELELQNLELERRRRELAYGKDMERYVPREQVEIELAGRAGILDAGLRHWIHSRAAEWITAMDGDIARIRELMNMMNRDLDKHINGYAAPMDYQVVFEFGEDDETAEEEPEADVQDNMAADLNEEETEICA